MESQVQAFEQLRTTLKTHLKKKLEDKVLEIIDMNNGNTDRDILEYIRLAHENGFANEEFLLKEVVYELGRKQIEANMAERVMQEVERKFEDYLTRGDNLSKVEPGLRFKARQELLESGRLDILAEDAEKREVLIELKAKKLSNRQKADLFFQLEKYLNEKEAAKAILIAPEIDPAIFFGFKKHIDSGRLQIYEVEGDLRDPDIDDYNFTRITQENLRKGNSKLDFRYKRKERDPSIIRVVKPVKKSNVSARHRSPAEERADAAEPAAMTSTTLPESQSKQDNILISKPAEIIIEQHAITPQINALSNAYNTDDKNKKTVTTVQTAEMGDGSSGIELIIDKHTKVMGKFIHSEQLSLEDIANASSLKPEIAGFEKELRQLLGDNLLSDRGSFFYAMTLLQTPEIKDKARYLNGIEIDAEVVQMLDRLSVSKDLEHAIESYEQNKEFWRSRKLMDRMKEIKFPIKTHEDYKAILKGPKAAFRYHDIFEGHLEKEVLAYNSLANANSIDNPSRKLKALKNAQENLQKALFRGKFDKEVVVYRSMLQDFIEKSESEEDKKVFKACFVSDSFLREWMLNEFLKTKISRTEGLISAEPNLAAAYLRFDLLTYDGSAKAEKMLASGQANFEGFIQLARQPETIINFIRMDNEIYNRIVRSMMPMERLLTKEELDSLPLHSRIIVGSMETGRSQKRYLRGEMNPDSILKNRLENLLNDGDLQKALDHYEEHKEEYDRRSEMNLMAPKIAVPVSTSKMKRIYEEGDKLARTYSDFFHQIEFALVCAGNSQKPNDEPMDFESKLIEIKDLHRNSEEKMKWVLYTDEHIKKYRAVTRALRAEHYLSHR